jgi:DNA-binding transcriptional LysR family regulator
LVPNDAGQRLDDAARNMHKSALAFQATSDTLRDIPQHRVRISVAEILAELLPAVMLSEIGMSAPFSLSIDMMVTNETLNLLERDADIALRHSRPEQQELICKRVGALEMGVFAHRDYVSKYGPLSRESLPRHRFIDGLNRDYLVRGAAQRGLEIDAEQILLRSDSIACQRAAVRAGWGIAAFPLWMARQEPEWLSVFAEEEGLHIEVWLVARPEIRDSLHLQNLFSRLGEGITQHLN